MIERILTTLTNGDSKLNATLVTTVIIICGLLPAVLGGI